MSAVVAACVVLLAGMTMPTRAVSLMVGFPAFFYAIHSVYKTWRPDRRLSLLAGSQAVLFGASCAGATLANVGLRLRMPLQDDLLAAIDKALGINTAEIVLWFSRLPDVAELLRIFYLSTVPAVFFCAIFFSLKRDGRKVWELTLGYSGGLFLCSAISSLVPAKAIFFHAGFTSQEVAGLPAGAGLYHMGAFSYFRDGSNLVVDIDRFDGVVTFPSFHTMMALVVAFAFRDYSRTSVVAYLWALLVIVSTIPIGGHYVVDLIAGTGLWAVIVLSALAWSRKSSFLCSDDEQASANRVV